MTLLARLNHQVAQTGARPESPGSSSPGPAAPPSLETVTPLKPSVALRLGRLTRPRQAFDYYLEGSDGACAVGSMATADGWWNAIGLLWRVGDCPVHGHEWVIGRGLLIDVVEHLNDEHHWSDAQIVAWLEGLGL